MKKGDIWLVDFGNRVGAEISKKRPALIVNVDAAGKLPLKVVAPITTWRPQFSANFWIVPIKADPNTNHLANDSGVDLFQVSSLSTTRFDYQIGVISDADLKMVETSLRQIFGL